MTSQIKNIIIFAGIGAVLVFVYFSFVKKEPEQPGLVVSPGTGVSEPLVPAAGSRPTNQATEEFLSILLKVRSIELNSSIFSDPAFASLTDSSITLVQDTPEGRPNPFAPIGTDPVSTPPAASGSSAPSSGSGSGSASSSPSSSSGAAAGGTTVPSRTPATGGTR